MPKFSAHKNSGLPTQTTNEAGGESYLSAAPFDHLAMTLGRPGFSEPSFYGTLTAGCLSVSGIAASTSGLTKQALEMLTSMIQCAIAEPEMFLRLASYARNELHVRLTPQIMLAVAARVPQSKPFVRKYAQHIIKRADEIKEVFAAYRCLFQIDYVKSTTERQWFSGSLPHSLRKALGDAFQRFDERDFLRYAGSGRPTFGDVLLMIYGTDSRGTARRGGELRSCTRKHGSGSWPVSRATFDWLVHGTIPSEPGVLDRVQRWAKIATHKEFTNEAKADVLAAGAGWEVVSSQFSSPAAWEWLATARIEDGDKTYRVMPAMATLRNLANFSRYSISQDARKLVCEALNSAAGKVHILPMRYLSAMQEVTDPLFVDALHSAIDKATELLPEIPGRTLVVVDVSGSMASPVTEKSKLTAAQAASVLGAMLFKRSAPGSVIGYVNYNWNVIKASRKSSVMDIVAMFPRADGGTQLSAAFKAIDEMAASSGIPDRVVILTDGQSWMERSTYALLEAARRRHGGAFHVHEVHMMDYNSSATHPDKRVHIFSTYSDSLLGMIRTIEGITVDPEATTVNVAQLRAKLTSLYS